MSKRLIRITSQAIYPSLDKLLKVEINAVMQNGNTIFGKLHSFTEDQLVLLDTRSHPHQLLLNDLFEIVYDA
ncbi:hypothetical protein [Dyadobacter bucti]|uniref:hypothetical protein n=1 Tax=Dyadobacter bucti TaxID=2572203 RepID=UPI003F719AF3